MKVVSNSSVLIGLSAISRLDILHNRFPKGIIIPDAVWREVVDKGHGLPGANDVKETKWIYRKHIQNKDSIVILEGNLDQGEAEVIVLGQEIGADLLLLDEKSARNIAIRLKYPVLGTVGVLIWAKRKQLIKSLSRELDRLQENGGFRLSQFVYEYALEQVDEKISAQP
jgi:hypothetical protein